MSALTDIVDKLKGQDLEKALGLKPRYPGLALGVDSERLFLVRVKPGRQAAVEAVADAETEEHAVPASMFDQGGVRVEAFQKQVAELLAKTGSKPGRASLILPDNLAKISLLTLPEKPGSAKALDQLVRAQMRRAVPFRLEEARLSFQMLPGEDGKVVVLVVILREALLEQFERALTEAGLKVGLIDLATPNLLNLCRSKLDEWGKAGDVAVLNSAPAYFSLAILRGGRPIFFRCKSYAAQDIGGPHGTLTREIANSLSYYREKLDGESIGTLAIRSVGLDMADLQARLEGVDVGRIVPIVPQDFVALGGQQISPELGQRLAPALGAIVGRR